MQGRGVRSAWDPWEAQMADDLWLHLIVSTALATVNHGHAQIKKRKTLVLGSTGPTEETQGYWKLELSGEEASWRNGFGLRTRAVL